MAQLPLLISTSRGLIVKKRNKSYRPREILADPISWAIAGAHTLPTESQSALLAPIDAAIVLLKQGKATRDDWNVCAQALNLAEALAGAQIGSNLMPQIRAGHKALEQVAIRMIERGTSTCYAAELAAIDEAIVMYRCQVRVCTQAEMSRALARVKELHRTGAMDQVAEIYEKMCMEAI
jgi:hypothetical protein